MAKRQADARGSFTDRPYDLLRRAPAHLSPTGDPTSRAIAYLAPDVVAPAPQRSVGLSCARIASRHDVGNVVSECGHLDRRRRVYGDIAVAELAILIRSPAPQCAILLARAGVNGTSGDLSKATCADVRSRVARVGRGVGHARGVHSRPSIVGSSAAVRRWTIATPRVRAGATIQVGTRVAAGRTFPTAVAATIASS